MRMDVRHDTVFSTRDEQLHSDLKAKEAGGVSPAVSSATSLLTDIPVQWA